MIFLDFVFYVSLFSVLLYFIAGIFKALYSDSEDSLLSKIEFALFENAIVSLIAVGLCLITCFLYEAL